MSRTAQDEDFIGSRPSETVERLATILGLFPICKMAKREAM
jgi:hypothetical protein